MTFEFEGSPKGGCCSISDDLSCFEISHFRSSDGVNPSW